MIEKIIDQIKFHFRKYDYKYYYWLRKLWRFILLWLKTWVIVVLVIWAMWHAARFWNGQWTDTDGILLTVEVITLIAIIVWYICDDDNDF